MDRLGLNKLISLLQIEDGDHLNANSAVMVGGIASPTAKCFEYNGSSWTSGGSLNEWNTM